MQNAIVECIANYSEGRRVEVIEAIAAEIRAVQGVYLLDRHTDADHNRTVLTFAGTPEGVEEAAYRSIAKAAELIDLEQHRGEHPRIGATDVVPFVPIAGVSMADCVAIANRLGARVGQELDIPVYLYEEAARRPERQNLENIRRGEYERLKEEIASLPERQPDYGPARVGSAGATVIGARQPLIAYNVYLTTGDVSSAKQIAKAIRHSSGGLRYVKGLGLLVEGRAQVSMNLTNFRRTPMARVVEMIRTEARRNGTDIHHSELVGLIPEDALVDAAVWYLQMDQFEPEQILERRLRAAMQAVPSEASAVPDAFLEALADGNATPGGGSASAYSGAAAAALVAMVARLTIGKRKYAGVETEMQAILEQAEAQRAALTAAVRQDSEAFEAVMAALRLPKDTPAAQQARAAAIESATLGAARVPLEVAGRALDVLRMAEKVVAEGNLNAISDGGVAAVQARAAITGAGFNVRINVSSLEDASAGRQLWQRQEEIEHEADAILGRVRALLAQRGGIDLP